MFRKSNRILKHSLMLMVLNVVAMTFANDSFAYKWAGTNERFEVAPGLSIGGSFRTRYEFMSDFKFNKNTAGNDDSRTLNQFRLNAQWNPFGWMTFFVEGQDARVFGENAVTNKNTDPSVGFIHDPWDLHQAYVDFKNATPADLFYLRNIRVGRQKINLGDERLVGALEWANTARVWDGVVVSFGEPKKRTLDVIAAMEVDVNPNNPNSWNDLELSTSRYQDSNLYGLYYTDWLLIENTQLELYWLTRSNGDTAASGAATSHGDEVHSIGTRFEHKHGAMDFNGEFVGQFGEYSGLDHKAFAGHIEAGYMVEELNKTRFALAYNYASGDDDSTDGKHTTFDNLFPTNHKFYGDMDFFAWMNMHNIEASAKTKLFNKADVRLAYQLFWLAQEHDSWYAASRAAARTASASANVSSFVGSELDLTVKFWIVPKRLDMLLGYGHFFAGSYIDDTNSGG
ncbi:MAG: alginate export family protein, partial [Candidatus Omnitrophica bacterium]|nr:alginate export family protein [Candidatus Omnitrophota bacterium]